VNARLVKTGSTATTMPVASRVRRNRSLPPPKPSLQISRVNATTTSETPTRQLPRGARKRGAVVVAAVAAAIATAGVRESARAHRWIRTPHLAVMPGIHRMTGIALNPPATMHRCLRRCTNQAGMPASRTARKSRDGSPLPCAKRPHPHRKASRQPGLSRRPGRLRIHMVVMTAAPRRPALKGSDRAFAAACMNHHATRGWRGVDHGIRQWIRYR
jgi:hypothetical protein